MGRASRHPLLRLPRLVAFGEFLLARKYQTRPPSQCTRHFLPLQQNLAPVPTIFADSRQTIYICDRFPSHKQLREHELGATLSLLVLLLGL